MTHTQTIHQSAPATQHISAKLQIPHFSDFTVESIKATGISILDKVNKSHLVVKVLGSLAILYTARHVYYRLHRTLKHYPPGPIGVPLFGSLFALKHVTKYAAYLASNYGSVSMVYVGTQPFVFLHSIDAINEVFQNPLALERDVRGSFKYACLKPHELHVAFCPQKYWPTKRRNFQSILLAKMNSRFLNKVHNHSLSTHVVPAIEQCIAEQRPWFFSEDINYIQFNSLWSTCFGTSLDYDSPERLQTLQLIGRNVKEAGKDLLLRYLHLGKLLPKSVSAGIFTSTKDFEVFLERNVYTQLNYNESVFDVGNHEWDAHFADVRRDNNACAAAKLIAAHRLHPDVTSTKSSILSALHVLFTAGVETSINFAEYALVLLAKFPKIQQQIYEELRAVFVCAQQSGNEVDGDGDVGDAVFEMKTTQLATVIQRLHLLRAFVQETARISSVAPIGVPHFNPSQAIDVHAAVDADGKPYHCRIPKQSVIIADIPSANRRDPYWAQKCNGRDTMDVCLDAWLDDNGHFKLNLNKNKNMSFGVGKRDCAGIALALRSAYLLFSKLLLRYEFQFQDVMEQEMEIQQKYQLSFVLATKIGLKVVKR